MDAEHYTCSTCKHGNLQDQCRRCEDGFEALRAALAQSAEPASERMLKLSDAMLVLQSMKSAAVRGSLGDPAYSAAYIDESIENLKLWATLPAIKATT